MVNLLIDYWYILVAFFAIGVIVGVFVYNFIKTPTIEKIAKVREWLLYAVTEAEKALGAKTGALKLASVYDMFVQKFPSLSKIINFDEFSDLVDDALDEMRELLDTNDNIREYVEGK